jgi:acyl phosphate:glycerol-3-phosphate acyltransferase
MEFQVQFILLILLVVILAYITGSIPTAVWTGKWLKGLDVRKHGSGNAGATNAMRVLGPKIGLMVLLVDALKGVAAVSLAHLVRYGFYSEEVFVVFQLVLGAAAITGHVLPVFASFKGGKGIATLVGIIITLLPEAFIVCLVVFLSVFLSTRYVSLASILSAIALPITLVFIKEASVLPKIIFALSVAFFVPIVHVNNIKRLIRGKENRISFRKKIE